VFAAFFVVGSAAMKGFLLGLLVAGLAVGGYFYWQRLHTPAPSTVSGADAGAPAITKKPP